MKLNNDAMSVQPCPVHGRKPELHHGDMGIPPLYRLLCPVPGCECYSDWAPTRTLAMEEWDSMAYGLSGRDETPVFNALEFFSGDDDQTDPFDPEEQADD